MRLFYISFFFFTTPLWADLNWRSLKEIVIQADLSTHRSEQKQLAKEALAIAEKCIQKQPKSAACYYYRGQARGIYYGHSFFGYVKRLRSMLKDWETALALDPTFDYGGPYRMIAEVYMELPRHFGPKDLRQDLKKAVDYLNKAIAISDYPTNYIDLAEALSKSGKNKEADEALSKAKKAIPKWKKDPYYSSWQTRMRPECSRYILVAFWSK